MQSNTPAPQEPTLAQKQAQLAENLAKIGRAQARRHAKAAPPPPSKAVTLEDHILEATDDILRVSAGLQSFLTLLDLQQLGEVGIAHIAARQELREMIGGLGIPEPGAVENRAA